MTRTKTAPQRLWRPDFRDATTLPDTKVIRTGFLLNFVAIAIAALCVTVYGMREYSLQGLSRSVRTLQTQVAESTDRNRSILDANKRFRQGAEIVEEAVAFDWQPIAFHTLLAEVSAVTQQGMILTAVQMQAATESAVKDALPPLAVELSGKILEDAPTTPAQLLSSYQEAIRSLPSLQGKTLSMEMTRFGRNNQSGQFDFTLVVKIPLEKAPSL